MYNEELDKCLEFFREDVSILDYWVLISLSVTKLLRILFAVFVTTHSTIACSLHVALHIHICTIGPQPVNSLVKCSLKRRNKTFTLWPILCVHSVVVVRAQSLTSKMATQLKLGPLWSHLNFLYDIYVGRKKPPCSGESAWCRCTREHKSDQSKSGKGVNVARATYGVHALLHMHGC